MRRAGTTPPAQPRGSARSSCRSPLRSASRPWSRPRSPAGHGRARRPPRYAARPGSAGWSPGRSHGRVSDRRVPSSGRRTRGRRGARRADGLTSIRGSRQTPWRSPGDCTFNPQTPTRRWVRDWYAASAVILVMGTTRTERLTKPLRNWQHAADHRVLLDVPLRDGDRHDQREKGDVDPPRGASEDRDHEERNRLAQRLGRTDDQVDRMQAGVRNGHSERAVRHRRRDRSGG